MDRYHLLLTLDGRPAMHGWWSKEATARRQFSSWVGERGDMPGGADRPHRRERRDGYPQLARGVVSSAILVPTEGALMTAARLTASDVILRIVSVAMMLNGIAAFVCGIAMFWGSLREVLGAPLIMVIGVCAHIGGLAGWGLVEEDRRARARRRPVVSGGS